MKKYLNILLTIVLLAGCTNSLSTTSPSQDQTENPALDIVTSTEIPVTETNIEKKQVQFVVHVPVNTPVDDEIDLVLLPFWDWEETDRFPMVSDGNGTWMATVDIEPDALIRYVYDRGVPEGADFKSTREKLPGEIPVEYRYLYVSSDIDSIEDVVAQWNDVSSDIATGSLSGTVTDSSTGEPVMDATISIGGLHIATNFDGSFLASDIPVGSQRVTVLTQSGNYHTTYDVVQIEQAQISEINFNIDAANKVPVTFNVDCPPDTPTNAVVRLVGNTSQLGIYPSENLNGGFIRFAASRQIFMQRTAANKFTATVDLYEGSYIQYLYTLNTSFRGDERSSNGNTMIRNLLVITSDQTQKDVVNSWRQSDQLAITFNVTVPINTPSTSVVFMNIGGPSLEMDKVGENQWSTTVFVWPGEEIQYKYFIGRMGQEKLNPDSSDAYRTISVENQDISQQDIVEQWRWFSYASIPEQNTPVQVTFRVTIPVDTPIDDGIFLLGDTPELGNGSESAAIAMTQTPTNPWMWEVTIPFDSTKQVTYQYQSGNTQIVEEGTHTQDISYNGQIFNDAVVSWESATNNLSREFVSGIYPDDLWEADYLSLFDSTLDNIAQLNADYVVVSSIWSYGQINPLPEVESTAIKASSVLTPTQDLIDSINMAHSKGLKVFLLPQFNMEMTDEGNNLWGSHSNEWWDKWIKEAEKFYMYNAKIAQLTETEILLLPGPGFQSFLGEEGFEDASYIKVFDQNMQGLINEVRENYSGAIVVSGAHYSLYDFPKEADFIFITPFDMGTKLNVPSNASVQVLKQAFAAKLDQFAYPMFNKYQKPVILQFTYDSITDSANGATGDSPWDYDNPETVVDVTGQADLAEAFFQAIIDRPWIGGTIDYTYHYYDLPEDETASMRDKPAAKVFAKYYFEFKQN